MYPAPVVLKVGGSLYDLPDLGKRLQLWLASFPSNCSLLVLPGGGPTADVCRRLDLCHALGEEAAHWLALRALTLNAHFLAALLPRSVVVMRLEECGSYRQPRLLPILDAHAFALSDECRSDCLPHTWAVTSDSIAARVADVIGAARLVLLKSATIPEGMDWAEAGRLGFVDAHFAEVLARRATPFTVSAVNLREWQP